MQNKKKAIIGETKLSGKEWFAQSGSTALVAEPSIKKSGEATEIDWELFTAEEDDENLDDLNFDDDENQAEEKQIGVYREPGAEKEGANDDVVSDDDDD